MLKGIDTAQNCQAVASQLAAKGIRVVARYYNVNDPGKNLTAPEAQALSAAGLKIVAVWENGFPTTPGYFSYHMGLTDATSALAIAKKVGQPNGAIYFAVDFDASAQDLEGVIRSYFVGVAKVFQQVGNPYAIGVYGSGLTCSTVERIFPGIRYAWMAMSTGWAGYKAFTGWSILQLESQSIAGLSCDIDECMNDCGAFTVAAPSQTAPSQPPALTQAWSNLDLCLADLDTAVARVKQAAAAVKGVI